MAKPESYESIRLEIARLTAERREVEGALPTRDEAITRLDGLIEHHGRSAPAFLNGVFDDRTNEYMVGGNYAADARTVRDLLCRYVPEVVRERDIQDIEARLQGATTMSAAGKKAALAAIDERLHQLQLDEETALSAAEEAAGAPIARRPDISADIFFECHAAAGTRAKFRQFEIHAKQLEASMIAMRESINDARNEMGRCQRNLEQHRRTAGRARQPVPMTRGKLSDGARHELITADPRGEERRLREFQEAKANLQGLQQGYDEAGERYSKFNSPYRRLAEALGQRVRAAA